MKVEIKRTIPARAEKTEMVVDYILCDLCRLAKGRDEGGGCVRWTKDSYSIDDVTISYREGDTFPNATDYSIVGYHVCPDCFKSVIVPFMQSRGAEPTKEQVDF